MIDGTAYIGGQRLVSGLWDEHRNPAHLKDIVARTPRMRTEDVDKAVAEGKEGFRAWSALDIAKRAHYLRKAAAFVDGLLASESGDALVELSTREHGRILIESRLDMQMASLVLDHYADYAGKLRGLANDFADAQGRRLVSPRPLGVCAGIVPWNFPVGLSMTKVAPALLAGNSIVLKMPDYSPTAASLLLADVAELLPPGVLNVLTGADAALGEALVRHPDVPKVALTGGTPTGKAVMAAAAEGLKRLTLELGGNDPAILLDDVVVDEALGEKLVAGAFTACGQVCFAIKRLYVPSALFDDVVDVLGEALDGTVVGNGTDPDVTMGPVNNERQFRRLVEIEADARRRHCEIRFYGRYAGSLEDPDEGYFRLPAIVVNPPHDATIVRAEQFGPILPIIPYSVSDDPVMWANDSDMGLCASIWTLDEDRGFAMAQTVEAGSVFVNHHGAFSLDFDAPFGGMKQSGLGREFGVESLAEYTETQVISTRGL